MAGALKFGLAVAIGLAMAAQAWAAEPDGTLQDKAQDTLESAQETAGAVAKSVNASPEAQEASAGILRPIYRLAEAFSFPAFHWIAFAVMVAVSMATRRRLPGNVALTMLRLHAPDALRL